MARLVSYSVVEHKNLAKPTEPSKFYAQAQSTGSVDLDELCERIQGKCTVHGADVAAVFKALEDEIIIGLQRGEIVNLDKLGTLRIGIQSRGAETRKAFTSAFIDGVHVNFRPGKKIERMLLSVDYRKVSRRGKNDLIDIVVDPTDDDSEGPKPFDPGA